MNLAENRSVRSHAHGRRQSLLDDVLMHLRWEQALTPEDAAGLWRPGLDGRVKRDFAPLIGGSWDTSAAGPVGQWSQDVAELRHRVVHGTYVPGRLEATAALRALDDLLTYLCDLLAKPTTLKRFPRTALALAGESGLRRRGAYSGRLEALEDNPAEPNWGETFARWRDTHQRLRRDQSSGPRQPNPAGAHVLFVRDPDGSDHWCLHDSAVHLAAAAELDEAAADPEQRRVAEAAAKTTPSRPTDPISVGFDPRNTPPVVQSGDWVEEYRLVPHAGVMVDRTDIRR